MKSKTVTANDCFSVTVVHIIRVKNLNIKGNINNMFMYTVKK